MFKFFGIQSFRTNQPQRGESGASAVELAFIILGAGIVLVAIFNWLVPAMTLQSNIAAGREGVGLASTLEGSVGRLGEGGQVVDPAVAAQSAVSFSRNLFDNTGLVSRAQAFETVGAGSPGACTVTLTSIANTCRRNDGSDCGALTSTEVQDKIKSIAAAECRAKDFYMGTEYEDMSLRNMKGQQVGRRLGFQPDFFVPSGGSGSGP